MFSFQLNESFRLIQSAPILFHRFFLIFLLSESNSTGIEYVELQVFWQKTKLQFVIWRRDDYYYLLFFILNEKKVCRILVRFFFLYLMMSIESQSKVKGDG